MTTLDTSTFLKLVSIFSGDDQPETADGSEPFEGLDIDADLRRADLRRANLRRANLSDADLSGANLSGANLRRANLSDADLSDADLRRANLSDADLSDADLSGADLSDADLSGANLSGADLRRADLSDADLSGANLSGADLRRADLSDADLSGANLSGANLSGGQNILSPIEYLKANFETVAEGYIAYKTFGRHYPSNPVWEIKPGAILSEVVNPDRGSDCGCGINVAKRDWNDFGNGSLWKVLIRWEWLAGVIVPFGTDGKIRCERVELIEIVN